MRDERGSWYLLTGLVLGLAIGLVYAWVISPRAHGDTSPAYLRADFKDRYRAMIALAYAANRNLPRAEARLNLLGDPDIAEAVSVQAQLAGADGSPPQEAQALALLAEALQEQRNSPAPAQAPTGSPASAASSKPGMAATTLSQAALDPLAVEPLLTETPQSGTSTGTVNPSSASFGVGALTATPVSVTAFTAASTLTPTLTVEAPFVLEESTFVCDPDLDQPLIQVLAQDSSGDPLTGVEVLVAWEGGEDHFFTGLKPELGLGYADFSMEPGTAYTLQLAAGGPVLPDLSSEECEGEAGELYWGSWQLVFAQP